MISIEPRRTALLAMDLQSDVLPRVGAKRPARRDQAAALIAAPRRARRVAAA